MVTNDATVMEEPSRFELTSMASGYNGHQRCDGYGGTGTPRVPIGTANL